jgi:hypothetical protein
MNSVEDLLSSVDGGREPPDGLAPTLLALWLAKKDSWHNAHEVAQDIDTPMGSWIHAYLHRVEGDLGNAGYWYRRAGKPEKSSREGLDDEWKEIVTVALEI